MGTEIPVNRASYNYKQFCEIALVRIWGGRVEYVRVGSKQFINYNLAENTIRDWIRRPYGTTYY
jgi:hypothetical protein